MSAASLVRMANDISNFFASEPDRAIAATAIAAHIRSFWSPRMRRQAIAHLAAGGDGFSDLARAAIRQLADAESATTP